MPLSCHGLATVTLSDESLSGESDWLEPIRFGASDGTTTGGLEKATNVGTRDGKIDRVSFSSPIPRGMKDCTPKNDLFIYVKIASGNKVFTFAEVGFYPRFEPDTEVVKSPKPAIRLNPCNNLTPIRSPYVRGREFQLYLKLPENERKKVDNEANRLFREETGIARRLSNAPIDRPLANHWLRIRDSVMSNRQ